MTDELTPDFCVRFQLKFEIDSLLEINLPPGSDWIR